MKPSTCISVSEISQVGEARRAIGALAEDAGLSETLRGQIAIIVTELGKNLVKHTRGKGGQLVARPLSPDEGKGIEVLSLDQGPGMDDVARCMSDGYSTAGSPGTGLGAIARLSSFFDIYSLPSAGTAIVSRVVAPGSGKAEMLQVGAICLPIRGETVSGDALDVRLGAASQRVVVADGLGHGPQASEAASEATRVFRENPSLPSSDLVKSIHQALRSTRGAAVAVALIDEEESLVHFSGLGNIAGIVLSPGGQQRRMVSHNGTAGLQVRRVQEFDYPWGQDSVLIMHSDGLLTHWTLEKCPGILGRHPALIAGILYRDYSRGRDDISVLVLSRGRPGLSWKGAA